MFAPLCQRCHHLATGALRTVALARQWPPGAAPARSRRGRRSPSWSCSPHGTTPVARTLPRHGLPLAHASLSLDPRQPCWCLLMCLVLLTCSRSPQRSRRGHGRPGEPALTVSPFLVVVSRRSLRPCHSTQLLTELQCAAMGSQKRKKNAFYTLTCKKNT